jgi:uncharacterized protein YecE (DUF72 family)
MLGLYAAQFGTVEARQTLYCLPTAALLAQWRSSVPSEFLFSLKLPQEITHYRRLEDSVGLVGEFCRRVASSGIGVGALLVQLSPDFHPVESNRTKLVEFLASLPAGFRWAFEFRHSEWLQPATLSLLERHGVALVLADSRWVSRARMLDLALEPTADFAYLRWTPAGRERRPDRFHLWSRVLEGLSAKVKLVLGYFAEGRGSSAVSAVRDMERMLGIDRGRVVER